MAEELAAVHTTDDDSDSSYTDSDVSTESSELEAPPHVRDKAKWLVHARMLKKAGLDVDHATHFRLDRVTDIGHAMGKRQPRGPAAKETTFVQTYTPQPKNSVLALMMDLLAEPRGKGFKCLHGTDSVGAVKDLTGWKPSKERRKASEFVDVHKRQVPRRRHARDRFFRARLRERRRMELLAAANGVSLPPPAWELRYKADLEAKRREVEDRTGGVETKTDYVPLGHASDDDADPNDDRDSDDSATKRRKAKWRAKQKRKKENDPATLIRRLAKNPGPYKRKERAWNFKRGARRKFDKKEEEYSDATRATMTPRNFPQVTIKSPRGNVVWRHKDRQYIQWLCTTRTVEYVKIELFDRVENVRMICPRSLNKNGIHFLRVPSDWPPGEQYRIKVSDVDDPSMYAFSPAFFCIKPSEAAEKKAVQRAARDEERRKARVRAAEGLAYESSDEETYEHKVVSTAVGARIVPPRKKRGVEGTFTKKKEKGFKYIVDADDFMDYKGGHDKHGRPHGKGTRHYMTTGGTYSGVWKHGLRHGRGTLKIPNSVTYEGMWQDDKFQGRGKMTFANGAVYEGNFAAGKRHGRGRIQYPSGFVYEGTWTDNLYHGMGKATSESGVVYEGRWDRGKISGMGVLTYAVGKHGKKTEQRIWERRSFAATVAALYKEQEQAVADMQERLDKLNFVHKELLLDDLVWKTRKEINEKKAKEREELIKIWRREQEKKKASYKWEAKKAARAMRAAGGAV